jgi:hypothetical protein
MAEVCRHALAVPQSPSGLLLPFLNEDFFGDEEFDARVSILWDRSIEEHLPADAVWGLVKLFTDILVRGDLSAGLRA